MIKNLIIFILIIILFTFKYTFADVMIGGPGCYNYDKNCYNKCINKNDNNTYECKKNCCIEYNKYCVDNKCLKKCEEETHSIYCRKRCKYLCNKGAISDRNEKYKKNAFLYYFIGLISLYGILYFYKKLKQ